MSGPWTTLLVSATRAMYLGGNKGSSNSGARDAQIECSSGYAGIPSAFAYMQPGCERTKGGLRASAQIRFTFLN